MRAVIQRVKNAEVNIEQQTVGKIGQGVLVFLGIENEDTEEDADWLVKKINGMRIFSDAEGKLNLSLPDIEGNMLVVSQFTLHAKYKKGNRPSFVRAGAPEYAKKMYNYFTRKASEVLGKVVATGEFAADMDVDLCNDGPVTLFLDTKNKE